MWTAGFKCSWRKIIGGSTRQRWMETVVCGGVACAPPCWRVMETGHPSTRAVNSDSGNRALLQTVHQIFKTQNGWIGIRLSFTSRSLTCQRAVFSLNVSVIDCGLSYTLTPKRHQWINLVRIVVAPAKHSCNAIHRRSTRLRITWQC